MHLTPRVVQNFPKMFIRFISRTHKKIHDSYPENRGNPGNSSLVYGLNNGWRYTTQILYGRTDLSCNWSNMQYNNNYVFNMLLICLHFSQVLSHFQTDFSVQKNEYKIISSRYLTLSLTLSSSKTLK